MILTKPLNGGIVPPGTSAPNLPQQVGGLGRQVDPNALVGANTKKLIGQGKLILQGGKYYMPARGKNEFWDNFGKTPPTKKLPKGGKYKFSTGGGAEPPPMGGAGGSGGGGNGGGGAAGVMPYSGASKPSGRSGGSLEGLAGLAGMGSISAGQVGAPGAGDAPIDVDPAIEPMTPQGMGNAVGGGQMIEAPGSLRGGLGNRMPPSLAALLKPKVY